MRGLQILADLHERDVRRCLDEGEDVHGVRLDPGGAPVATLRTCLAGARRFPMAHQIDHGRRRYAEAAASRPTAHPLLLHGADDAKS
jgi:hypothetical protein